MIEMKKVLSLIIFLRNEIIYFNNYKIINFFLYNSILFFFNPPSRWHLNIGGQSPPYNNNKHD